MILNELKLNNFCIYKGEHEFNLAPSASRGKTKPVVLFGGMNGGCKTTILDAVQLVLYGKRSKCSKRGDKSYEDFLRGCINHDVDQQMGASIGLTFLYASEGSENVYEVSRMWAAGSGGAIRERVSVMKDGEPDHWMAENWNQLVDDLIPFGVAQLCFFDAEKIRFLAEDETSSVALGEAIKALLGLDLAERLVADTTVLEGRIAKRVRKSDELKALAELEETWREKKEVVERFKQDLAGVVPQLERATSRAYKAEADFAKVGGKHWEQREQRQRQKGELEKTVEHCEESLVNLAGGALPLALVGDLLGQMAEQAQLERSSARPLPAIIDTPMGRLDSEHRNQLVERYFPHASHQVIILSTDTEIEERYFEQLKPSVARAYHLNYDEAGRMTTVEEGYFWKVSDVV